MAEDISFSEKSLIDNADNQERDAILLAKLSERLSGRSDPVIAKLLDRASQVTSQLPPDDKAFAWVTRDLTVEYPDRQQIEINYPFEDHVFHLTILVKLDTWVVVSEYGTYSGDNLDAAVAMARRAL